MAGHRGWAEYLGGTRVRFHFDRCDHTFVEDFSKKPVARRMGPEGTRLMASWWSREKGGVIVGPCRRCKPKSEVRK